MEQLYLFLQKLKQLKEDRENVLIAEAPFWNQHQKGRIHKVCQYIVDHCDEPILLSTVADQIYLCPEAFCRYFKQHTGITFVTFLHKVRVAKACEMMISDNSKTIFEIAYSSGFGCISSFNRTFKRIMGMTATDYLRNLDR
ncbi:helix-turn-helix domain-containing protein [Sphingobacterium paucimobilis]|uniref:HTH araC/xylS-type domain-containing protein n=1 Tax=Sphingobacterium paucimobilis HER1398 TaxID=1346330 RepID=U2HBA2_9SPHI|nr:AraC family transcriptional regulator [Sphingobacterium paucimobilis]ERJ59021.1 hypothetical protein M472_09585 [Sphingobacterium paucimobilis HER1398]